MSALTGNDEFEVIANKHAEKKVKVSSMKEIWDQFKDLGREEGRTQGIAEGRSQGIVEGRSQGIAEGRTQGIAEGRSQGIKEGRSLERAECLQQAARNLMESLQCTASRALDLLRIPPEEQGKFLSRL